MKPKNSTLFIIGILFVAFNLRAPITAVGPLLGFIREDLLISNGWAGFLTTIPLLAFAVLSPLVSKICNRLGTALAMFGGLLLLFCGELVRSYAGFGGIFYGTICIGIGIAFGNVLLPSIIKERFPFKIGLLTSLYTSGMGIFSGLAAGTSVPLAQTAHLGWQNTLGLWALFTLFSLILWSPQLRQQNSLTKPQSSTSWDTPQKPVYTSFLAWHVTFFMGLQSFLYYCFVSWLPSIAQAKGADLHEAGYLALLFQLISLPASFLVPILADRMKSQKPLVLVTCCIYGLGIGGFFLCHHTILLPISIALCGIGSGASFSLAMAFIGLRASHAHQAAALSGMAQSIGYTLAAIGPFCIGILYDRTNSWTNPFLLFLLIILGLLFSGMQAGAGKKLFQEDKSIAQ